VSAVGTPLNRWRVGYLSVHGHGWADFSSLAEARRFAQQARRDGCQQVTIMREYESGSNYYADFRRLS